MEYRVNYGNGQVSATYNDKRSAQLAQITARRLALAGPYVRRRDARATGAIVAALAFLAGLVAGIYAAAPVTHALCRAGVLG